MKSTTQYQRVCTEPVPEHRCTGIAKLQGSRALLYLSTSCRVESSCAFASECMAPRRRSSLYAASISTYTKRTDSLLYRCSIIHLSLSFYTSPPRRPPPPSSPLSSFSAFFSSFFPLLRLLSFFLLTFLLLLLVCNTFSSYSTLPKSRLSHRLSLPYRSCSLPILHFHSYWTAFMAIPLQAAVMHTDTAATCARASSTASSASASACLFFAYAAS